MSDVTVQITPYMPDGRPAPFLMTQAQLVEFLQVETKHPRQTVDRMRRHGLRAVQVSRRVLYRLPDVIEFLEREQRRVPR